MVSCDLCQRPSACTFGCACLDCLFREVELRNQARTERDAARDLARFFFSIARHYPIVVPAEMQERLVALNPWLVEKQESLNPP